MKLPNSHFVNSNKAFVVIGIITALILSIPLVAMQFTDEVDWNLWDFVAMGLLLFGMGSLFVLVARRLETHKLWLGLGFLILTLYIWAELAVGVFTNIGS